MSNVWVLNNKVIRYKGFAVLTLLCSFTSLSGAAQTRSTLSGALGVYKDEAISAQTYILGLSSEFNLTSDPEMPSSLQATYTDQKLTKGSGEDAKKLTLDGGDSLESKRVSFQGTQNFGLEQSFLLLYETGGTAKTKTQSYGTSYQRWFANDRFRLGGAVRKNETSTPMNDFTDLDGKRVNTPDRIEGMNYGLNTMTYINPSLIGLADYSYTTRNDRPDAWSTALQARQYLSHLSAALHVSLAHYENVGTIRPVTTYGSIVANTSSFEWHQKLLSQYILMGGYRIYMENEKPRISEEGRKTFGSDYIYSTVRYRFLKNWTYRCSELSASIGHYLQNAGLSGMTASVGVEWVIQ